MPGSNEMFGQSSIEQGIQPKNKQNTSNKGIEEYIKKTSELREENDKKEENSKADKWLDSMLDSEPYTEGSISGGKIEGPSPDGNTEPGANPEVGEGQTSPGGIEGPEPDGNSQSGEVMQGGPESGGIDGTSGGGIEGPSPDGNSRLGETKPGTQPGGSEGPSPNGNFHSGETEPDGNSQSGGIEGPEPNRNGRPREIVGGRGDLQEKISKNGETGKIAQEVKEDDLFSSLFNELSDSAVVYSVNGVNINVHKGSDEHGNFVQIEKIGHEDGIVTDYRLCRNSDGGYSLMILKDKNIVDQVDNLTKEELVNKVLPNFRNRINEGRDIMNQKREEKMKNFDLYASIDDQKINGLENASNNLV